MSARACEHCGGRLLRDLELGAEVFSTEPVLKCINCGRVPGVRRAPTDEESGASLEPGRQRRWHSGKHIAVYSEAVR